jgi:acyl carrier protein phosphodiesterase
MNYLAHTLLSFGNEYLLIGNFITDFINAKQARALEQQFQKGVNLHRHIDNFTDSHQMFIRGRRRLAEYHGKYSPVVLDILYDYLLAKNWHRHSDVSLGTHAKNSYRIFEKYANVFVENGVLHIPKMINHDFLQSYAEEERVRYVLGRMDNRTKFESQFYKAMDHLLKDYDLYEEEFNSFFPDVIAMVKTEIKSQD